MGKTSKGLPSIGFNLEHVLRLEGTEIGKLSPKRLLKEIKGLENESKELKRENEKLKDYVRLIFENGMKFIKEN